MAENNFFLTICIPSYNRPEGLKRALESVDAERYASELQILVCEDYAPKRLEVRAVAEEFKAKSKYSFKYVENEVNLGHGKNWRHCAHEAEGLYLMYLGDDDMISPNKLDQFMEWLHNHDDLGYVCRAYQILRPNGFIEDHRYYSKELFFEPGEIGYVAFFMKSNFMSGYTIRREYTYEFEDSQFDYTLLYQMYLMSEVCLKYKSGYCPIPVAQEIGDGISYFGVNEAEKKFYKPGVAMGDEIANIKMFFVITEFIDKKYGLESSKKIKHEFSNYSSYSTMVKFRNIGGRKLLKSTKETLKKMGLDDSKYFNLYYFSLYLFGTKFCQNIINLIKKINHGRLNLK